MTRFRIWADTHSTGVIDPSGRSVTQEETTITDATWASLQEWVRAYDPLIPLGREARAARLAEIHQLDQRGLALRDQIRREWPRDPRTGEEFAFDYFSEGLIRML